MAISKIKTNSIANDAITSDKLATGGIATVDMADGSVTSLKILDGGIATVDIANNAITTAKLDTAGISATFAAGAVGTPSITTAGDTNTGIFFPAADTIAFAEGGAEAMRIDSSGNVGIGTTSPSGKLHSYATSGTTITLGKFEAAVGSYTGTSLVAANTLGASSTYNLFSCITDSDADAGGPVTQFLVRGDGNVGIGTSSPTQKLTVSGSSSLGTASASGNTAIFQSPGSLYLTLNTNGTLNGNRRNWAISPEYDAAGALSFTCGASEGASPTSTKMIIDSSGNVGIGTNSPAYKLDVGTSSVAGNINTFGSITNGTLAGYSIRTIPRLTNDTGTFENTYIGCGATVGNIIFQQGNSFTAASNTERMRIDSSGNMGINTSSPAHKLDVQGNVDGPIVRILNNRDTTGSFGIKVTLGASGGAGTTGSAHFHGNTNAVGNWYLFGNGTTSYSSDQRLKKNIESARDGYLEDLARLRVVKYNWNVSEEGVPKELGLIAQEVEQVFPGLVQDDYNPVTEGDDTVYKQLKQSVLPFMLLKAIQELKAEFDEYKRTHP